MRDCGIYVRSRSDILITYMYKLGFNFNYNFEIQRNIFKFKSLNFNRKLYLNMTRSGQLR